MKENLINRFAVEKLIYRVLQIENIILNQKCVYQYEFSSVEMDTDLPVLVFSEKRSLLKPWVYNRSVV